MDDVVTLAGVPVVDDGVTLIGVSVVDDNVIVAIVLTDTVCEVDITIMDDDAHVLVPTMLVSFPSPEPEPLAQFAYATIKIKVFIDNNNISPLKQSQSTVHLLQQLYILGILQQHNNY